MISRMLVHLSLTAPQRAGSPRCSSGSCLTWGSSWTWTSRGARIGLRGLVHDYKNQQVCILVWFFVSTLHKLVNCINVCYSQVFPVGLTAHPALQPHALNYSISSLLTEFVITVCMCLIIYSNISLSKSLSFRDSYLLKGVHLRLELFKMIV